MESQNLATELLREEKRNTAVWRTMFIAAFAALVLGHLRGR